MRFVILRKAPVGLIGLNGIGFVLEDGVTELHESHWDGLAQREVIFRPTGRFETRVDGIEVEVFEPMTGREETADGSEVRER